MSSKNELVVKSNRLVEASYRLSLVEQRAVLLAIVHARETGRGLNALDFVSVTAKDYAERFNVDEKNAYAQIKEAGNTLYERGFVLHDTDSDSGKPRVIKARWVSAATYIDGAGTIQLRFSPEIVPYITQLEAEFTRYKLEKVANMNSAYAIRLYELLIQWGSVGRREIELEWLKKTLMVDKDYPRLFDFKKWVIDVALAQINEHSDLTASYSQRKTGRNVTHLTFTFAPKEDTQPKEVASARVKPQKRKQSTVQPTEPATIKTDEIPAQKPDEAVVWQLLDLGVTNKVAKELVTEYGEENIQAAISYTKGQQGKIKSPAGFVVEAIKNEYRDNQAEQRKKQEAALQEAKLREEKAKRWETFKAAYRKSRDTTFNGWFPGLDKQAVAEYRERYVATLSPCITKNETVTEMAFMAHFKSIMKFPSMREWGEQRKINMAEFEEELRKEEWEEARTKELIQRG